MVFIKGSHSKENVAPLSCCNHSHTVDCTNAGKTNHDAGEYGPLVSLTEVMGISPHEWAHKPDKLIIYKKGKLFYILMNNECLSTKILQ